MRILYITPSFQHPTVRGCTRCYHFIRELSQHHTITLLSPIKSAVSPEAIQEMASYTEQLLTFDAVKNCAPLEKRMRAGSGLGKRITRALQVRDAVKKMKSAFLQLIQQSSYDLVLFHGKDVFTVIEGWSGLPIVVDFCDATSLRLLGNMRHASRAKLPWLLFRYLQVRQIEKKLVKKTPHLAFISGRDRDAILGPHSPTNGIKIIPIGVDFDYWTRKTNNPHPNCIVFTGVMDYPPNADSALYLIEKILPLVRQSISNLEVFIVGRNPSPALMDKAQHYPNVTVTGWVDDMRPYFERATVYVAPLRFASGIQNKLLEALAMEVPVVTTPIAAASLHVEGGTKAPLLVADRETHFAECIVHLLRHARERSRLAAEGRCFVENHFSWSQSAQQLEEMCLEAVARGQAQTAKSGWGR